MYTLSNWYLSDEMYVYDTLVTQYNYLAQSLHFQVRVGQTLQTV